jgi:regulatory protein
MKGNLTPLDYAYRLLGQRAYSAHDLAAKLCGKGFTQHVVEQAVERLTTQGYLNDAKLAADITSRLQARGYGPAGIRQKLAQKGLDRDLVEHTIEARESDRDLDAARKLVASRFPADALQHTRTHARAFRLLLRRGYSYDVAKQLLGNTPRENA